ncbi:MAG: XRE family transcriptional regulator [Pseudomonadota bacterium]
MQLRLPMLTYYDGPRLVAQEVVDAVNTYRQAVLQCWELRSRRGMTKAVLAEEAGLYASHVSDYLNPHPTKRELPAKHIAKFEESCGNRIISQWLAKQANLTILEVFIERRAA